MRRNRFTQIGIDRLVRLLWLEKVSNLSLAGNDPATIKCTLQVDLQGEFRSIPTTLRGSLDKTITILRRVWCKVPVELESLRVEGLELLNNVPKRDQLVIHWGMVMAVYPFWYSVATQTNRLLRLQGTAAMAHIQRRIRDQYGERETVSRAVRFVLRSYLDWGVLQKTGTKGIYSPGMTFAIEDPRLIAWLAEATLHARAKGSVPLKDLIDHPGLFPFQIKAVNAESIAAVSSRLDILRHGLDDNLVMRRELPSRRRK